MINWFPLKILAEKKQTNKHVEIIFRHVVRTGTDRFVQSQFDFLTWLASASEQYKLRLAIHPTQLDLQLFSTKFVQGVALEKKPT